MKKRLFTLLLLLLSFNILPAQPNTMVGKIQDQVSNAWVGNATVDIPGKNAYAITTDDGVFQLKLPQGIQFGSLIVLRVSCAGYTTATRHLTAAAVLLDPIRIKKSLKEPKSTPVGKAKPPLPDQISAIEYYRKELQTNELSAQFNACKALGEMGRAAKPALKEIIGIVLYSNNVDLRILAIETLIKLGINTNDVKETFRIAMKSDDDRLQLAGLQALRKMHFEDDTIVRDLLSIVKNADTKVSIQAMAALLPLRPQMSQIVIPQLSYGLITADTMTIDTAYHLLQFFYDSLPVLLKDELVHICNDSHELEIQTQTKQTYSGREYRDFRDRIVAKAVLTFYSISKTHPDYVKSILPEIAIPDYYFQKYWPKNDSSDISYAVYLFSYGLDYYPDESTVSEIVRKGKFLRPYLLRELKQRDGSWAWYPLMRIEPDSDLQLFDSTLVHGNKAEIITCMKVIEKYHLFSSFHIATLAKSAFRSPDYYTYHYISDPEARFAEGTLALAILSNEPTLRSMVIDSILSLPNTSSQPCYILDEFAHDTVHNNSIMKALWQKETMVNDPCGVTNLATLATRRLKYDKDFFHECMGDFDSKTNSVKSSLFYAFRASQNIDTDQVIVLIRKNLKNNETDNAAVSCLIGLTWRMPKYQAELQSAYSTVRKKELRQWIDQAKKSLNQTPGRMDLYYKPS